MVTQRTSMKFPSNPIVRKLRERESVGGWLQRIGALNRASVYMFHKPLQLKVADMKTQPRDIINKVLCNMFSPNWEELGRIKDALADELKMYDHFIASSNPTRVVTFPSLPKFYCVRCLYEDTMRWEIPKHQLIWNSPVAAMCFKHNEALLEIQVDKEFGLYHRVQQAFGKEEAIFLGDINPPWLLNTHHQNHLTPEVKRIASDLRLQGASTKMDMLLAIYFIISYKRNGPGRLKYLGDYYNNKRCGLMPFPELAAPDSLYLSKLSIPEKCLCFDRLAKCIGPTPSSFPNQAAYLSRVYSCSDLSQQAFGKLIREQTLVSFALWVSTYWNSSFQKEIKKAFPLFWPIWEQVSCCKSLW